MYQKHEGNFFSWTMANAKLINEGKTDELDREKLIEEIKSMERSEWHKLIGCLGILIASLSHNKSGHDINAYKRHNAERRKQTNNNKGTN